MFHKSGYILRNWALELEELSLESRITFLEYKINSKNFRIISKWLVFLLRPWWSNLIVLTKVMGYWLVTGNGCCARCPSTDIILKVCWLGGPCVMYYWEYRQRSLVTIHVDSSSNIIPLHDTWHSGSMKTDWGLINFEIVWSDLGVMRHWVVCSELVCKIFFSQVPINSEMLLNNLIFNQKVSHFHWSRVLFLDSVICNSSGSEIIK